MIFNVDAIIDALTSEVGDIGHRDLKKLKPDTEEEPEVELEPDVAAGSMYIVGRRRALQKI